MGSSWRPSNRDEDRPTAGERTNDRDRRASEDMLVRSPSPDLDPRNVHENAKTIFERLEIRFSGAAAMQFICGMRRKELVAKEEICHHCLLHCKDLAKLGKYPCVVISGRVGDSCQLCLSLGRRCVPISNKIIEVPGFRGLVNQMMHLWQEASLPKLSRPSSFMREMGFYQREYERQILSEQIQSDKVTPNAAPSSKSSDKVDTDDQAPNTGEKRRYDADELVSLSKKPRLLVRRDGGKDRDVHKPGDRDTSGVDANNAGDKTSNKAIADPKEPTIKQEDVETGRVKNNPSLQEDLEAVARLRAAQSTRSSYRPSDEPRIDKYRPTPDRPTAMPRQKDRYSLPSKPASTRGRSLDSVGDRRSFLHKDYGTGSTGTFGSKSNEAPATSSQTGATDKYVGGTFGSVTHQSPATPSTAASSQKEAAKPVSGIFSTPTSQSTSTPPPPRENFTRRISKGAFGQQSSVAESSFTQLAATLSNRPSESGGFKTSRFTAINEPLESRSATPTSEAKSMVLEQEVMKLSNNYESLRTKIDAESAKTKRLVVVLREDLDIQGKTVGELDADMKSLKPTSGKIRDLPGEIGQIRWLSSNQSVLRKDIDRQAKTIDTLNADNKITRDLIDRIQSDVESVANNSASTIKLRDLQALRSRAEEQEREFRGLNSKNEAQAAELTKMQEVIVAQHIEQKTTEEGHQANFQALKDKHDALQANFAQLSKALEALEIRQEKKDQQQIQQSASSSSSSTAAKSTVPSRYTMNLFLDCREDIPRSLKLDRADMQECDEIIMRVFTDPELAQTHLTFEFVRDHVASQMQQRHHNRGGNIATRK